MPSLIERALSAEERVRGPKARLAVTLEAAPPKLRAEAVDLIVAAQQKRVGSTTAAAVLNEALAAYLPGGKPISDEMVRRYKVPET